MPSIGSAKDLIIRIDDPQEREFSILLGEQTLSQSPPNVAFKQDISGTHRIEVVSEGLSSSVSEITLSDEQTGEIIFTVANDTISAQVAVYSPEELAQEENLGLIAGVVKSAFEDNSLTAAAVQLVGQNRQVETNEDGQFLLPAAVGVHQIRVTYPNHESMTSGSIAVFTGERTLLDVVLPELGDSSDTEEVIVFGIATGLPTAAAEMERQSTTVMEVLNQEDLSRMGDSNVAGAIQRVTGVSVVDDKFAVVRGLAGRYIASSLDSGLLPSTDFLRRDVPLDLFPSGILGGIQIEKSYRPELPGDTTGGLIGMQSRGIPDEATHEIGFTIGMNTEVYGEDVLGYDGGDRDWLGVDDGTRELPSRIDATTDYGRESLPDVCPPPPLTIAGCVQPDEYAVFGKAFPNIYAIDETSGQLEFGLSYSQGNRFSFQSGDFGYYFALDYSKDSESRNDGLIETSIREGDNGFIEDEVENYQRTKLKVDLSAYLVLGYETDSGTKLDSKTILLRKSSDVIRSNATQDITENKLFEDSVLQWTEQQMLAQKFSGHMEFGADANHLLDARVGFARSTRYEPDKRTYTYENGFLTASRIERKYSDLEEDAIDVGVDYKWEVMNFSRFYPTLKAGFASIRKDREFESARFGFTVDSDIDRTQPIEEIFVPENFDDDLVRVRSSGESTDYFDSDDTIDAVYLSTETDFGESISMLLGARYETSEMSIEYPLGDPSDAIDPLESDDLLPAFMLTWRALEDLQVRAGVSKTLSRPGLVERSNTIFFDPDTDEKIVGNPNLINSEIDNLDVRLEYYFSEEESVTLALFYKDIANPIEKTVPAGVREGYTFRNSKEANLTGLEIDFRKIIIDDGAWYLFLAGNAAFIDSEVELDDQTAQLEGIQGRPRTTRQLQGQSEYLANFQVGLDNFERGHSLTFMINYFGDRINRVDNVSRGDEIELGRTLLDLNYKYEMNNGITINSKINNILDEEVTFESNGERQRSVETYSDGVSFSVGVAYEF